MKRSLFAATVVSLCSLWAWPLYASQSSPGPAEVPDFALLDHEGQFRHLYYYQRDERTHAIVLFVQGNGCPLVRKRVPELNALKKEFAERGVVFWMINANSQDTRAEVAAEADEFKIDWPILLDSTQLVAESLQIHRTAEAILIQPRTWKILYRGAVSDRLSYEAEKPAGAEHLRAALEDVLAHRPVARARSSVEGCRVVLTDGDSAEHAKISYSDTIAPLLVNRCVRCHSDGGIGPWAMTSYRKVRGWSEMIREVVMTRRMPPWQGDPQIGHFANDFSLTAQEQKTLLHWIAAGAPRGSGPDPLESWKAERKEWELGTPDKIMEIGEQEVPAEGVIEYRYVTIDSPFAEDTWVRAVEINPGNTRVLHHVIVTTLEPGDEKKEKEKSLAGYAPGMGPDVFPPGTGVLIKRGAKIKFQLHYTASGKQERDATRLGLYLAPGPQEKELHTGLLIHSKFKIPPGAMEFGVAKTNKINADGWLYSMNPHMHFRGKRMRYELFLPDGSREVLLSVPNYHFNWQRSYRLKEPKFIPKGSRLVVDAAWDNSPLNPANPDPAREVTWGEQSWDEMFFASYQFVYGSAAEKPVRR